MSKTLICTNTLTVVHQIVYANHIQFYTHLVKQNPDDVFATFTPVRMTIDACRNAAAKLAMESEFDYVMFIDDDVILPLNAYTRLKSHDKDIVAGWTVIRGYPFQNMFFRFDENENLITYEDVALDATELVKVDAIGCSCVLIKTSVFKRTPPPYFVTGTHNTEDIWFCLKAKQFIPELEIFVDPTVKTPHLLAQEAVTPENKIAYKRFYDEVDPPKDEKNTFAFRGDEYLKRIGGEE